MYNPAPVFRFVSAALRAGQAAVLVTVIAVTGGSTRNPGAHLAVRSDGTVCGSLSGGCIEAAVAAEALEVLRADAPRVTRYGAGSPYIDLRLPCGGSLDLLFTPLASRDALAGLAARLDRREAFALQLPLGPGAPEVLPGTTRHTAQLIGDRFTVSHVPAARLLVIGDAAAGVVLSSLAAAIGIEVLRFSPGGQPGTILLSSPTALPAFPADPWTGAVVLFHDHDWEPPVLAGLLAAELFHVGAMGSLKTHAARRGALRGLGVADAAIDRIAAPIGLIPSLRDPETLAVSILAEVIERYNAQFLASAHRDAEAAA